MNFLDKGNIDSEDELENKSKFVEDLGYDPKELVEILDGWELFKKKKGNTNTMVKRYCYALDQDYVKNKITVCAHLNNIFDLYLSQRKPFMRTYAG